MKRIPDKFNGYLKIDDTEFSYNIDNFIVSLLPVQNEQNEKYEAFNQIRTSKRQKSEFLFGNHQGNKIAFLRNNCFHTGIFGMDLTIRFATPLIIEADGNAIGFYSMMTEPWYKFHAITFWGGVINSIFPPQVALKHPDIKELLDNNGVREIKIRSWNDYKQSIDFIFESEKINITISVSQSYDKINKEDFNSYTLGELNSFIKMSFEHPKTFDDIIKYYNIMKSLFSILTVQNNNFFEVYLSQRNTEGKYFVTANCKIFDGYENYCKKSADRVINISNMVEYIPNLINQIEKNKADTLLELLPNDNKDVNKISIKNVQDICTALEVSYAYNKDKRNKDKLIKELKENIKETIQIFITSHPEIDVNKKTTINSAFQYLDYTLKEKIIELSKENCEIIDEIIKKKSLPLMSEKNISEFVKLRNQKTHSGTLTWNDSVNLYPALLAIVYATFFRNAGLKEDVLKSILQNIF